MQKERSTQGFGLALFSLVLLAGAFVLSVYLDKCIIDPIIAFLSAILATAAFIESRRANGPKRTTLIILIITILGTIFSFFRTASVTSEKNTQEQIIERKEQIDEDSPDKAEKMKELEEKIEELEDAEKDQNNSE